MLCRVREGGTADKLGLSYRRSSAKPVDVTDLDYDAGPFVAAAERVRAEDEVACGNVVIGVAQAGRGELDHELALARRVQVELGHLPFARWSSSRWHQASASTSPL